MAPAFVLSSRPGDPQAAKAAVAAAAVGKPIEVAPLPKTVTSPFGGPFQLRCPAGDLLHEGNAAARAVLPAAAEDESWLDWEESALRPAVYRGSLEGGAALAAALTELNDGLDAEGRLVGASSEKLSLAEVAIFCTLAGGEAGGLAGVQLPPKVKAFCDRLTALDAVKAGLEVTPLSPRSPLFHLQYFPSKSFFMQTCLVHHL
jgi:hypothetical protein